MKEEIKTIKCTVDKIDKKLDVQDIKMENYFNCKLDKEEFNRWKDANTKWVQWLPTIIMGLISLTILIFRG